MSPGRRPTETARLARQLAEVQTLAHIGSWEWDVVSSGVTWTDEHYRIWGIALGSKVDMATVLNGIHPDDRARVQCVIDKALADGKPYRTEFRVVRPDGSERIVEARGNMERDAAGQPLRSYGTAQDVTERTHIAASLARVEERAEDLRDHLLARAISAQEEERTRIARELHDETGQALTAILLGLRGIQEATDSDRVIALCERLRDLTAQTIRDVGRIARGLRPSTLDDLGLVPALRRYADDLASANNLEVTITDRPLPRLRPELETAIYRMVQEALNNVARHADAQHATVTLGESGDKLRVIIEDDGHGIDLTALAPRGRAPLGRGLGLIGMQERASLVGGRVEIASRRSGGARITLEVPLETRV